MANIQVSFLVPQEVVEVADEMAGSEKRSRSFILNRWVLIGKNSEVVDTDSEAQNKKIGEESAVGGVLDSPDPDFAVEPKLADSGFLETPPVPEEAIQFAKYLQEKVEAESGVDPAIVMEMNKAVSPTSKRTATAAGRDTVVDVPKLERAISKKIAGSLVSAPTPKIGEKCPHGWANWMQCEKCNPKLAEEEF